MLPEAFPRRHLSLAGKDVALGGAGSNWQIAFRVAPQEQTQWCWAAVSSSVARYFNASSPWKQCAVVTAEMQGQCCVAGSSQRCNQPHYLDAALRRVGHLRAASAGYMLPAAVAAELDAQLPLCIRVGWSGGGGHFLAIVGLTPQGNDVILALSDPIFGESSIQGAALINGGYQAGGGTWTHSYAVAS